MTLGAILDRIRATYVDTLAEAVAERARECTVEAEPVLCDATGEPVREGEFNTPFRLDLSVLRDGEVTESLLVESAHQVTFEPIRFAGTGGLAVTLNPSCGTIARLGSLGRLRHWSRCTAGS